MQRSAVVTKRLRSGSQIAISSSGTTANRCAPPRSTRREMKRSKPSQGWQETSEKAAGEQRTGQSPMRRPERCWTIARRRAKPCWTEKSCWPRRAGLTAAGARSRERRHRNSQHLRRPFHSWMRGESHLVCRAKDGPSPTTQRSGRLVTPSRECRPLGHSRLARIDNANQRVIREYADAAVERRHLSYLPCQPWPCIAPHGNCIEVSSGTFAGRAPAVRADSGRQPVDRLCVAR